MLKAKHLNLLIRLLLLVHNKSNDIMDSTKKTFTSSLIDFARKSINYNSSFLSELSIEIFLFPFDS